MAVIVNVKYDKILVKIKMHDTNYYFVLIN